MPGKHKYPTIAFRPRYKMAYEMINTRARLSGMPKCDYITKSCINKTICFVGKKENAQLIVDELKSLQMTLLDIIKHYEERGLSLLESNLTEFEEQLISVVLLSTEIINSASYLWDAPTVENEKCLEHINQLKEALIRRY